jgi:hypothetical protein
MVWKYFYAGRKKWHPLAACNINVIPDGLIVDDTVMLWGLQLCKIKCDVKMMTGLLKYLVSEAVVLFCYKVLYRRSEHEMKSRIAMVEASFNKSKTLFTRKLDLNLRKKPVKCCVWSVALCGAETGTLRTVDQKYQESFKVWCWRRLVKNKRTSYLGTYCKMK